MKLTVIGSSPAWPNPEGAHSGYLVESTGRLLLDCGPGVLARMRRDTGWPEVDAIAITHFHLDHWGDLVPWVWGSRFGPGAASATPRLHLPPGGKARLAGLAVDLSGMPDMFERAFEIDEYAAGVPFESAGFELVATPLTHYTIESFGFRLSDGLRTLAYSGDSGPDERLAELARDADLFICEATLEVSEPPPRGHLSLEEAEAAFSASGARRLLITHRPGELAADARFEVATDGLELDV